MKYEAELNRGHSQKGKNKKFLTRLKKEQPKDLDTRFHQAHAEVFEEINCLDCANCCKTTSPLFLMVDIERLATHFRISPQTFIEKYLKVDYEGDYVLKTSPCPFLLEDNYCSVYEDRPKACREYPHTNRKRMYQITDLTLKNSLICPAVVKILEILQGKG